LVRMYVFAKSKREATSQLSESLSAAGYKVVRISDVGPNGSNKPWPMDNMFITSQDITRARRTGEVVCGWFIGYTNTEPSGFRQRRANAKVDNRGSQARPA